MLFGNLGREVNEGGNRESIGGQYDMKSRHPKSVLPPQSPWFKSGTSISMPVLMSPGSCMSISIVPPPLDVKISSYIHQSDAGMQVFFYRSFLSFVEKGVVHEQNADAWECGKGALSAKNAPRTRNTSTNTERRNNGVLYEKHVPTSAAHLPREGPLLRRRSRTGHLSKPRDCRI